MPCWDCQLSLVNYNLSAELLNNDYIYPADSRPTVNGAHQSIFGRQSADFVPILASFLSSGVKIYYNKSVIYSRPKVTLHFSFINISILVLILSKWNIAISFQHFSTHNS